jgi:hypothetical protein
MTDDLIPDGTDPGATARDDELAARLAVPPLDELTRRRLVRDALDATPATSPGRDRRRRAPWWAAAAAVLVIAVAATALALRSGSGSGGRPTAAAPTTQPERSPGPQAGSSSGTTGPLSPDDRLAVPAPAGTPASGASLGDLGEVADHATLRKRVAAAERSLSTTESGTGSTQSAFGAAPVTPPCTAELAAAQPRLGPVLGSGTATFHGAPATVVTARNRSGDLVAVVIVDAGCAVEAPVTIPG